MTSNVSQTSKSTSAANNFSIKCKATMKEPLKRLETYLRTKFPNCPLIPMRHCVEKGKQVKKPFYGHKYDASERVWKKWEDHMRGDLGETAGFGILLREKLLVIDVDNAEAVKRWEEKFPVLRTVPRERTRKGMHYYFLRTPECDKHRVTDGKRLFGDTDIKTVCSTGTGGYIVCAPSPDKEWIVPIYERDPEPLPEDILQYMVSNMAVRATADAAVASDKPPAVREPVGPLPTVDANTLAQVPVLVRRLMLECLSDDRAYHYNDWVRVAQLCRNLVEDANAAFSLFDAFSRRCPEKYPGERALAQKFATFRRDSECVSKVGMGTLRYLARLDNPGLYDRLIAEDIRDSLLQADTHQKIAKVAYNLYGTTVFCVDDDHWYVWDHKKWSKEAKDSSALDLLLSEDLANQIHDIMSSAETTNEQKKQLNNTYRLLTSANGSKNVVTKYKNLCKAKAREDAKVRGLEHFEMRLDSNKNLIGFNNGVYDLDQRCFREAVPDDMVTMTTGYNYQPFDPSSEEVAFINDYLKKLYKDDELIDWKLQCLAQALRRVPWGEVINIEVGTGANAKTSLFRFMEDIFGDYCVSTPPEQLTGKHDYNRGDPFKARLLNPMIVYSQEPEGDQTFNETFIKQLTGGDKFLCRLNFANQVQDLDPTFSLFLLCNNIPNFKGSDRAWQRRVQVTEYKAYFDNKVEKDDYEAQTFKKGDKVQLYAMFRKARAQFMAMLIERYQPGLEHYCPESVRITSENEIKNKNPYQCFMDEMLEKIPDAEMKLKPADYRLLHAASGFVNRNVTQKEIKDCFNDFMREHRDQFSWFQYKRKDLMNYCSTIMGRPLPNASDKAARKNIYVGWRIKHEVQDCGMRDEIDG